MKQGPSFAKKQGTVIALACAAAFAAPQALAQFATPDFGSGKGLTLSIDYLLSLTKKYGSGSTAGAGSDSVPHFEVASSSSSIYLKGSEKLNTGFINGWGFVFTTDFDGDTYSRRGAFESAIMVLGVETPAGSFFIGDMDSPYKSLGSSNLQTGSGNGTGMSGSAFLGIAGFSAGSAKGSRFGPDDLKALGNATSTMSFYRLVGNSINWYSPTIAGGLKFYAQYVPADTDLPATNPGNLGIEAYSGAVSYVAGPFNVGYIYEKRNDYLWGSILGNNVFGAGANAGATGTPGTGSHSSDKGQLLTAGFTFGDFKIGGYLQRLEFTQNGITDPFSGLPSAGITAGGLNITNMKADSWFLSLKYRTGPHEVVGWYTEAADLKCSGSNPALVATCNTDTGMQMFGVGYRYSFSKQFRMFVSRSEVNNERNADFTGSSTVTKNGLGSAVNRVGQTYTNYSFGMSGNY